jgi:hypothetical protein
VAYSVVNERALSWAKSALLKGGELRAGDARGAIKMAGGDNLLGFLSEIFFVFRAEGVALRASPKRNKIAGCWRGTRARWIAISLP